MCGKLHPSSQVVTDLFKKVISNWIGMIRAAGNNVVSITTATVGAVLESESVHSFTEISISYSQTIGFHP